MNPEKSVEEILEEFKARLWQLGLTIKTAPDEEKWLRIILEAERQKREEVVGLLKEILDLEYKKRNPPNQHNILKDYSFDVLKAFNKAITQPNNTK